MHQVAIGLRMRFRGDQSMSSRRSFVSLALAGEAMTDEIDDFIDRWHRDPRGLSLHDYLGMDRDEYALWLSSPDTLPLIITSRKFNTPLDVMANDDLQAMRLAARADDATKIKRLQAWLRSRNPS
jgi:hypothetical protein